MISSDKSSLLNSEDLFSSLQRLGWSSFFQDQLSARNVEYTPARVTGVRKNIFLVKKRDGEMQATVAGRLYHEVDMELPVVGDWVLLRESVITQVLLRKNALTRRAPGGRSGKNGETYQGEQVMAANLDMVFVVCGLDRDFNLRRIERYLTMVYNCGINPVVILTKADLHQNHFDYVREVEEIAFGVPVYAVSLKDNDSLGQLANLLQKGRTAALIGSSGAGKSTLINRLSGAEIRTTQEVGTRVGKGKHTTTTRDLIVLPAGGMVIDNPGIREIALSIDEQPSLSAFPDIEEFAGLCRFDDCSHTHEPGCRVVEAVNRGELSPDRLQSYQKLRSEISYLVQRETKGAARVEKERWKGVAQKIKSLKKRKH